MQAWRTPWVCPPHRSWLRRKGKGVRWTRKPAGLLRVSEKRVGVVGERKGWKGRKGVDVKGNPCFQC